jgi:hypothetical protein
MIVNLIPVSAVARPGPVTGRAALVALLALGCAPGALAGELVGMPFPHEHVLLARQVEAAESNRAPFALAVLLHNVRHSAVDVPPCHFHGALHAEVIGGDDSASDPLMPLTVPLELAPGQALAVDLVLPEPAAVLSEPAVQVVRLVDATTGARPCPVHVQVLAVEVGSAATQLLVDRFTLGVQKTFPRTAAAEGLATLGFVGGNAAQAARLVLLRTADKNWPMPTDDPDFEEPRELLGHVAPRLAANGSGDGTGPVSFDTAWPIKWSGPIDKRMAIVDIDFSELGATKDTRVDIVLRIPAGHPAPAASGLFANVRVWDIVDLADPATPANSGASLPTDRVYFNYHHFHN